MAARKPPWKKGNPKAKAGRSGKLAPASRAKAKRTARKAGRRYPNLVDNMRAAAASKSKKKTKKKTGPKKRVANKKTSQSAK
jgi:hypothetical protein